MRKSSETKNLKDYLGFIRGIKGIFEKTIAKNSFFELYSESRDKFLLNKSFRVHRLYQKLGSILEKVITLRRYNQLILTKKELLATPKEFHGFFINHFKRDLENKASDEEPRIINIKKLLLKIMMDVNSQNKTSSLDILQEALEQELKFKKQKELYDDTRNYRKKDPNSELKKFKTNFHNSKNEERILVYDLISGRSEKDKKMVKVTENGVMPTTNSSFITKISSENIDYKLYR